MAAAAPIRLSAETFSGMPRRGLERDQRAHGMADEPRLRGAGGIEQRGGPVGHAGDGRQRRAGRAAVAGQIRRQHATAVMGEPAAVQGPGGMVEAGAVQEHDGRQRRVELASAGGDEGIDAVDVTTAWSQPFCEARSAWPRSSMMSAAASMPTDSRTISSPMPAASSCAASIC